MIAIGRLHVGAIPPEWLVAWEELRKPRAADGSPDWVTYHAVRQVVHAARNEVVRSTLDQQPDATHLFFLDDDVLPPPDALERLLADSRDHDCPIVTGLYVQRGLPFYPVVFRRLPDGHHVQLTRFADGLQEVDACGAGCLLIRTDVLRAIRDAGEPWFDWPAGPVPMSEDMAFCARAKRLGFPIALDFGVQCRHLTTVEVGFEVFAEQRARGIAFAAPEIEAASTAVRPWPPARAEVTP